MLKMKSLWLGFTLPLIVVLGMSSCALFDEPSQVGEVSAKRVGDRIELAVCHPLDLVAIYLQQRVPGFDGEVLWDRPVNMEFVSGEPFTQVDAIEKEGRPDTEPYLDGENRILVQLVTASGRTYEGRFQLGVDGLQTDSWLNSDGTVTTAETPCLE
jgi:hypothetical protein